MIRMRLWKCDENNVQTFISFIVWMVRLYGFFLPHFSSLFFLSWLIFGSFAIHRTWMNHLIALFDWIQYGFPCFILIRIIIHIDAWSSCIHYNNNKIIIIEGDNKKNNNRRAAQRLCESFKLHLIWENMLDAWNEVSKIHRQIMVWECNISNLLAKRQFLEHSARQIAIDLENVERNNK